MPPDGVEPPAAEADVTKITWYSEYAEACDVAKVAGKMLFVYFYTPQCTPQSEALEAAALGDEAVRRQIRDNYIAVRVPLDAQISVEGQPLKLLDHASFAELQHKPGIAIIDFAHPGTEYYGYVVSIFPLQDGRYYRFRAQHLAVVLDLPPGTLSQRTLVFAVRTHPERPLSTEGRADGTLMVEAESHSRHQAEIHVQGHHNWDTRFHRIGNRLPGGLSAQEVVAESWPNEGILDAAIDCVDSWRQSSGHWGAVRRRQPLFGYDMKRGKNGIWYATGIFGNRH